MRIDFFSVVALAVAPSYPFAVLPPRPPAQEAAALMPKEIAKHAFPSVLMVSVNDRQGHPLSIGSGFVIRPGVAVTNLHVIEGGGSASIRVIGQKEIIRVTGVVSLDERNDLALLSFENSEIPPLRLASDEPEIGDEVYSIGNPRGLEGTFSAGIVSGLRRVESDSLLQITAPISRGSSGGPVLNNRGEVVGVAVAAIRDGQNLNFAIPVAAVGIAAKRIASPKSLQNALSGIRAEIKSTVKSSGGELASGVKVHSFEWLDSHYKSGDFGVSVKNQLDLPIKNVEIQVIFYSSDDEPLDVARVGIREAIESGLASRRECFVNPSVKRLTTKARYPGDDTWYLSAPYTRLEFRVLTFEFAD